MLGLLLGTGIVLAAPEMIPEDDTDLVGRTAPGFSLATLDGGQFSLEEQRGKTVVLSFWASWCTPCRYELPALQELSRERPDILFVAVNVDRDVVPAKRFLRGLDLSMPVVLDSNSEALGDYGVMSMPTMFLIDKNGTVQLAKTGFSKEKGLVELEAAIDGEKK
jgi:thiol-disulfide isomerase/thioredoxin